MNNVEAVKRFITGVLEKNRAARLCALVSTSKGERKFLRELSHGIEAPAARSDRMTSLRMCDSMPCYLYWEREGFGAAKASVGEAYNVLSVEDSWLIVSQDGTFGIYRPEARWDDEVAIRI